MWVWRFTECHKTACETRCFLSLGLISAAVGMWEQCFSPHALHGSMLNLPSCGCDSAYRTYFLPHGRISLFLILKPFKFLRSIFSMDKTLQRCWPTDNPLHISYHDNEWGVPLHDDQMLFEFLVLGGFQAGLTWWLILQRRDVFRAAFDNFDPVKVAKYSTADIERLMHTEGLIKNKLKIGSAINNAQQFLAIQKEFGSFDTFIWRFVNGKTIHNSFPTLENLPAETDESRAMSRELKALGFKFVGPTICYAFMQAIGMVNDHLTCCYRHKQIRGSGKFSEL